MDATAALAAVRNGNTDALLDALTVDDAWTITAPDGFTIGTLNLVGSTVVWRGSDGGHLNVKGHATDDDARRCAMGVLRGAAMRGAQVTDTAGKPVALVPDGVAALLAALTGLGVDPVDIATVTVSESPAEGPMDGPATGMYV